MLTCEAPDFWGLHKNKNWSFPLTIIVHKIGKKTRFYHKNYGSMRNIGG